MAGIPDRITVKGLEDIPARVWLEGIGAVM